MQTARLVTSAEMWTEQRENDSALDAIDRLQGAGARHIHATRIALNANLQSGRWDDALKAVRLLEKRNALHPVLARKLKHAIYRELMLAQRHDPAALEASWRRLPQADRAVPEIALEGARLLNVAGRGQLAAEVIETALGKSPAAWDDMAERLLDEYARAQAFPARGPAGARGGVAGAGAAARPDPCGPAAHGGIDLPARATVGQVEGLPAGQPHGGAVTRRRSSRLRGLPRPWATKPRRRGSTARRRSALPTCRRLRRKVR